jgi:hypothetical protein
MSQQRDGDQHNMYTEWPKSLGVPQVRQSAGSNMKSHDGSNRRASIQHVLQNFPKSALVPETASLSTRLPSTRAILTLSSEAILKQQQLQAKIIRKKLPTPLELQKEPSVSSRKACFLL